MKKPALIGIATLAFALGAFAQGVVNIDDSLISNGVADLTAGTYYSGTYGMEVWELSGVASVPAGINVAPAPGSGVAAYSVLGSSSFTKELTFFNQTMSSGTFTLGGQTLTDVTPAGSTVVLALAVWNNSGASWGQGIAQANAHAGVVAFMQPTVTPATPPPVPAALAGWSQDLVMTSVPEPGTLALAGLGVAALLILRRRK